MSRPTGYASIPRAVLHDESLSAGAKMTYLALSSFMGADDTAWPSHAKLASVVGVSERSVRTYLHELRDAGVVSWVQRFGDNAGQTSNAYRFHDIHDRYVSDAPELVADPPGNDCRPPRQLVPTPPAAVADERTSVTNLNERTSVTTASSSAKKPRKNPAVPLPADWKPNDSHRAFAAENGVDLTAQATKLRNWAEANDKRYASWDAMFRNWLIRAAEDGGKPRQQSRQQQTDDQFARAMARNGLTPQALEITR